MPGPQVCVGGCLRVVARGMAVGARFRRASGTPPLRFAREWAVTEACPSSGPAGPPSPKGEGKGCCWRQREVAAGWGHPALRFAREWAVTGACPSSGPAGPPSPTGEGTGCCWRQREVAAGWGHPALRMGIWKRSRGLRGHPFPGRRTVGAGHARPGGWREHPFPFYRLTLPTSPPAYSQCCRRQNRWGRSAHRPDARFRRWIRSRGASGHRRSGPDGTGVCCRCNFSAAG